MSHRHGHGHGHGHGQKHIDIEDFAASGSFTLVRASEEVPGAEPSPPDPLAFTATSPYYGRRIPMVCRELDRGRTVLCEVVLVAAMMMLCLGGFAGQYVAGRWAPTHAYRRALAQELLQETVQAVHACSFDALHHLNGAVVDDSGNPQHSDFKVEIAVTPSKDGRLCIKTVLRETKTLGVIAERVIYREPS